MFLCIGEGSNAVLADLILGGSNPNSWFGY